MYHHNDRESFSNSIRDLGDRIAKAKAAASELDNTLRERFFQLLENFDMSQIIIDESKIVSTICGDNEREKAILIRLLSEEHIINMNLLKTIINEYIKFSYPTKLCCLYYINNAYFFCEHEEIRLKLKEFISFIVNYNDNIKISNLCKILLNRFA